MTAKKKKKKMFQNMFFWVVKILVVLGAVEFVIVSKEQSILINPRLNTPAGVFTRLSVN